MIREGEERGRSSGIGSDKTGREGKEARWAS